MKTLGVLGGMSWESTAVYYRLFNQACAPAGGQHSAKLLLASVDFAEIVARQHAGDWHGAGQQLAELAAGLQNAGADAILIATNTMHKVAEHVQAAIDVPCCTSATWWPTPCWRLAYAAPACWAPATPWNNRS